MGFNDQEGFQRIEEVSKGTADIRQDGATIPAMKKQTQQQWHCHTASSTSSSKTTHEQQLYGTVQCMHA